MRTPYRTILLALAILLTAFDVIAQETTQWARVEGWSIRIDNTVGYGCYIHARYESGTNIRLGHDPGPGNVYLIIGNPAWRSIEQGKAYGLSLRFDDLAPWNIRATGIAIGNRSALAFELINTDFTHEFMRRHILTISYRNTEVDRIELSGSFEAVNEMLRCQEQIEQAQGPSDDREQEPPDTPKNSLGRNPSRDPFF